MHFGYISCSVNKRFHLHISNVFSSRSTSSVTPIPQQQQPQSKRASSMTRYSESSLSPPANSIRGKEENVKSVSPRTWDSIYLRIDRSIEGKRRAALLFPGSSCSAHHSSVECSSVECAIVATKVEWCELWYRPDESAKWRCSGQ
jgi:hypothetical protein